jgi:hypothetical protein
MEMGVVLVEILRTCGSAQEETPKTQTHAVIVGILIQENHRIYLKMLEKPNVEMALNYRLRSEMMATWMMGTVAVALALLRLSIFVLEVEHKTQTHESSVKGELHRTLVRTFVKSNVEMG